MPLNFDPNNLKAAVQTLFQGKPQNPLYGDTPPPDPSQPMPPQSAPAPASTAPQPAPQAQAPAPPTPPMQPGQIGAAMTKQPADVPPNPSASFSGNAPIANAPTPFHHGKLASILLGVGEALGNPLASHIGQRDRARQEEVDEYTRSQPATQFKANQAAELEAANISHAQAQTHLENVQADLAQQNLPLQEAVQKHYQHLSGVYQNKEVPDFDSYAQTYLQGLPPVMARMLAPHLQAIKQMPQTGKGYKINMQDDLPTSVNVYGKDYDRNDPELAKLPVGKEAAADFDRAAAAHQTKRSEKLSDEKTTAGFAAERQAQGFQNAQSMEATKKMQPAIDTALTADQRLARMEKSYTKGIAGDQQAMLALLADHLGMTFGMQKGAKLNRGLIEEAQQSQPWLAKIGAKFDDKGYLSGVALGPEQMKQMLDLGYDARDQAWKGAHDASTTYGVPLPQGAEQVEKQRQPGAKPLLQQGGQGNQAGGAQHVPGGKAAGLKEGDTGTGSDGKKYVVKGGLWVNQ